MGFFDRFKKYESGQDKKKKKQVAPKAEEKAPKKEKKPVPTAQKAPKKSASQVQGEAEATKVSETKIDQPTVAKKEDTGDAYKVLLKPLVTEKATNLSALNKYVFEVALEATKIEIKKAIKNVYGIEPVSVNILHVSGKKVRFGRTMGTTKNRKKAIVAFKSGQKIEVYEGV
jgi:large subunit ribosomal protein L23